NLSQNVVHSDSDLILHNSSVLIDKEPQMLATFCKVSLVSPSVKLLLCNDQVELHFFRCSNILTPFTIKIVGIPK
ncbi:hypothetical protein GHA88_14290, partial [Enterococcus faecium]|nr:hypothetical protein [Enterococcus faecium]